MATAWVRCVGDDSVGEVLVDTGRPKTEKLSMENFDFKVIQDATSNPAERGHRKKIVKPSSQLELAEL